MFGFVVLVACIFGWDMGGAVLWNAQPFLTAVVCLGKGVLAGLAAGGRLPCAVSAQHDGGGHIGSRRQSGGQYRALSAGALLPVL